MPSGRKGEQEVALRAASMSDAKLYNFGQCTAHGRQSAHPALDCRLQKNSSNGLERLDQGTIKQLHFSVVTMRLTG